jgi:hypothetical protein
VFLEELRPHDELSGDELSVRPQFRLVEQDLPAGLLQDADVGLGNPRAGDLPLLEGLDGHAVVLADDGHVTTTVDVSLEALALEVVPGGDVLGVADRRGGHDLAPQVFETADLRLDDESGATGRGTCDHAHRLPVGLRVRGHRWRRTDVGGVQPASQQSLDRVGAGVEVLGDQSCSVLGEGVLVEALGQAHQGGAVREVGEVAKPHLDLLFAFRARGVPAAGSRGEQEDQGAGQRRAAWTLGKRHVHAELPVSGSVDCSKPVWITKYSNLHEIACPVRQTRHVSL